MYTKLARGDFGNTVPQFFDVEEWLRSSDYARYELWGVRSSKTAAHPHARMNLHRHDVAEYARRYFPDDANISPMIDAFGLTAWFEVVQMPCGLVVEGIEYPSRELTWRVGMPDPARRKQWSNTAAMMILRKHLNENSLCDLFDLLELYPENVVELSALSQCFGSVPHRNGVIWEVRAY